MIEASQLQPRTIAKKISVLLCDDHRIMAEGLAALLNAEVDLRVVAIADRAAEGLRLAESHRPDVVLLDYQLPDGDGVAVARTLREAQPALKVVMLTAFTSEAVLRAAMEAGCSGYLSKHNAIRVVADGIRLVMSGEAFVSPDMLQRFLPQPNRAAPVLRSALTPRELEVLELLATGAPSQEIAARLFVSSNTLRNHVQKILTKLGAHSRLEAVSIALREEIIRRS